ncbi:MAG TPA: transcriptional regulator [Desulfobacterales bacterium]|nr:transcriptional regulator [Desulfobacterales bacterium]
MAKPFRLLRDRMSPEAQKKSGEKTREMLREIRLRELCADMDISTLRRHIREMGGSLEIVARFPEGDVRLSQFEQTM